MGLGRRQSTCAVDELGNRISVRSAADGATGDDVLHLGHGEINP
jgi:hypothetical protein